MRISGRTTAGHIGRVALVIALISCAGDGPSAPAITTITVNPASASVAVGETLPLAVTVGVKNGAEPSVTWSSDAEAVATVDATGRVTGVTEGSATISARSTVDATKIGTARIAVTRGVVATVTIDPNPIQLTRTSARQLSIRARTTSGVELPGRTATWQTGSAAVATISAAGVVTAVDFGATVITATVEGVSATAAMVVALGPTATVDVSPATALISRGASATLAARVLDDGGNAISGKTLAWSTSNAAVATVSATGVVSAVAAGTASITASVDGKSGASTITVTDAAPASVAIAPRPATLDEADQVQLSAVVRDAAGRTMANTVTWSSTRHAAATVSAMGLVTAIVADATPARIIASTTGGVGDTLDVLVRQATVASVGVALNATAIEENEVTQSVATPRDGRGRTLQGRAVAWRSTNAGVALVNATGLITAVSPGTTTITATVGGVDGSAQVTVTRAPIDRIDATPSPATVNVGGTITLTPTVRDRRGLPLMGRTITWTSAQPSIATVSAAGVVTGVAVGSTTITMASEGKSADVALTVTAKPLPSVVISTVRDAGTQTLANLASTGGALDLVIDYTTAEFTGASLEALIDGSVAVTRQLGDTACNKCQIIATINTATFDQGSGAPRYLNGAHTLGARLVLNAAAAVTAPTLPMTLANSNAAIVTASGTRSASNPSNGARWLGGDITISARPVFFSGGSVTGGSVSGFGQTRPLAGGGTSWSATFSGSQAPPNGVAGFTGSDIVTVTWTTSSGTVPAASVGVAVDNGSPSNPTIGSMPLWINDHFSFASVTVTAGGDAGVGGVSTALYLGFAPISGPCNSVPGSPVTSPVGLAESSGPIYRLIGVASDALGNKSCASTSGFGIDNITPMIIVASGPAQNGVWPLATGISFAVQDTSVAPATPSGFFNLAGSDALRVSMSRTTQSGTTCIIGSGAGCAAVPTAITVGGPPTNGYYSLSATVADQAGNVSAPAGRFFLVDATAPAVGGISFPASMPAASPATFSAGVNDDLDLASADAVLTFPGGPVSLGTVTLGAFGPGTFSTSAVAQFTTSGAAMCQGAAKASAITITVRDQAGNTSSSTAAINPAAILAC